MTTIGTITYHKTINYGAILQTYALQRTLVDMGYVSEIIDYWNPQIGIAAFSRYRRVRHFVWHGLVKKMLVGTKRQRKTEEFRRKYLRLSVRNYPNAEILRSDPPLYDAYITGSDQVWNPRINNNDSSYFLTFVPQGKRTISYAASFGVSQIQDKFASYYKKWLKQIDSLSTREVEGKQIIKQLTGRDAEIVLDPTLLLDQEQWCRIAVPYKSSKPYILCYYMPGDKEVNKSITELARQVSTLTGWGVICLGQKEYMRLLHPWRRSIFDAGPAEFLGLFQNASFIVTNSFHGTAFAVNYRKPFFVPINQELAPEKALSSRITTLMKTLKLEYRLLPVGGCLPSGDVLDMDYQSVETILQQEKQRSIDFLRNALGEA